MKKFLSLSIAALMALPAIAESFTSGEFTFLTTSETTVELTAASMTEGDVTIPETVTDEASGKTYTVTTIGASAFMSKDITSLTMPNTVTSIGNEAFKFCFQLQKIHLSDNLESIGANAFQTTRSLKEINWPASLKSIKTYAFQYSMGYDGEIRLPKGVEVDDFAFVNMDNATSLWLDGQPDTWGTNQFEGCKKLNKFYLNCTYPPLFDPSLVFSTDEWDWDGPTEITLYVPTGAKDNYTSNEKWTARFKTIEEYEFTNPDTTNPGGDTPGPDDRQYETYTDTWNDDFTVATLNVPEAGKLNDLLGEHKSTLKELTLSGKLNGDDILCLRRLCGNEIDASKIEGAILEKIDLTNCEIVPGGGPYYSYKETFNSEQDVVGPNIFLGAYSLKSFSMPKYAESIGKSAFEGAENMSVFNCNETLKSIGELAFYNCKSLESVTLPDCCTTFADMVFYVCSSLKSVKLPSTMTSIPFATFYFCESLPEITLPDGIKSIENLAFHNCASLTTVNIPAATYKIAPTAFGYCEKLTDLKVNADNQDFCDIDGVLFNKSRSTLILYPSGKEQARFEVPEGTMTVGEQAMSGAKFKELSLPEGLTTILTEGVASCKQLEQVEIPSTLATMDKAFDYCYGIRNWNVAKGNPEYSDIAGVLCNADGSILLKYPTGRTDESYTVPTPVKEIAEEAFYSAALKNVTLSEGVATVDRNAFALCAELEVANLPASLTMLHEGSFGMTALKEVHCAATVPPVCEFVESEDGIAFPFVGVEIANCKLFVPQTSVNAYKEAKVWKEFDIQDFSGVDSMTNDTDIQDASYYTVDGQRATSNTKGITILRSANGRTQKIIRR